VLLYAKVYNFSLMRIIVSMNLIFSEVSSTAKAPIASV
jgi:hypothetical protein